MCGRSPGMLVFLDFEASSLSDNSYPIEVGWVWEDGREEAHLICPARGWTDWDAGAEAIHGIARSVLERDGEPHDTVARRMVDILTSHDLRVSAPSWDGKWLSALLRAAGLPRHALRLKDSDELFRDLICARHADLDRAEQDERLAAVLAATEEREQPTHRALADARAEWQRWRRVVAALA